MSHATLPRMGRLHLQQIASLGLALLFIVMGWAGVADFSWWQRFGVTPQPWWHLIPLVLMAGVLLLRIRRPLLALLLGVLCVAVDFTIGLNLGMLLCLSDLIYSFALRASPRTVSIMSATLAALSLTPLLLVALPDVDLATAVMATLTAMAVLIMPMWWASEVRRGHPLWQEPDTRASLEAERHATLLRSQAAKRREAIEAERRQMARELHDVVSSQVSAIALTSGAVLHAPADAKRDRQALETIRRTSVDALDQLSAMVRLLRGSSLGYEELLDEASWQGIIDQARAHGLEVHADGELPSDLPPRLRHVVLRVLQESLTNALKHGRGSAHISTRHGRQLMLTVQSPLAEDSGAAPSPALGSGTGLIAMRERVELAEGTFTAGKHRADSGVANWVVRVTLPCEDGTR